MLMLLANRADRLGVEIPLTTVTVKAYDDRSMCPKGSVKPGQLI